MNVVINQVNCNRWIRHTSEFPSLNVYELEVINDIIKEDILRLMTEKQRKTGCDFMYSLRLHLYLIGSEALGEDVQMLCSTESISAMCHAWEDYTKINKLLTVSYVIFNLFNLLYVVKHTQRCRQPSKHCWMCSTLIYAFHMFAKHCKWITRDRTWH